MGKYDYITPLEQQGHKLFDQEKYQEAADIFSKIVAMRHLGSTVNVSTIW